MGDDYDIMAKVKVDLWLYWSTYVSYYFGFEKFIYNFVVSLIFVGLLLFVTSDPYVFKMYGWMFLVTGVGFFTFFIPLFLLIYSILTVAGKPGHEINYLFNRDHVVVLTNEFETKIQWTAFKRVNENNTYIRLTSKSAEIFMISKLSFMSLEDLVKIRKLFKEKLGDEAYLKNTVLK